MISSGINRREFVDASRKASSNVGTQNPIGSRGIQAFEEHKIFGIGGCGLVDRRERFHDDMRVTDDLSPGADLLRSSKVICISVNEVTGLKVLNGHRDREWRIFDE